MPYESTNLSRRKLLKAGAIGVPAAGVLAFGSTLVTATSANASPPTAGGAKKPAQGCSGS